MLYLWVNILHFNEEDFWKSSLDKIIKITDIHVEQEKKKAEQIKKSSKRNKTNSSDNYDTTTTTENSYSFKASADYDD